MNAPRSHRISDLYHRALERAPEERAAFLAGECQGDARLHQEVESLLAFQAASASFLESPPVVAENDDSAISGDYPKLNREFGPYTIVAPLGVGGMGEVYSAIDNKLNRAVAIKVLRPHLTAGAERRARFEREARLLATLNHPNIGAIYGMVESDGITALVLELVEGTTLAHRLEGGALSLTAALAVARQIADALDAAHEKGIVHRDLKPANIVVLGDGNASSQVRAKVLDFGLGKMIDAGPRDDASRPAARSGGGTVDGRILGTPAYMSPEQARGLPVDKRTDIWSFGCIVFEMLSGHRAFDGETVTDTLAGVLDREPDWSLLPASTPAPIRTLLARCLRKDSRKRLRDIADAAIELDNVDRPDTGEAKSPLRARAHRWIGWGAVVALATAALVLSAVRPWRVPPVTESIEFSVAPPDHWRPPAPSFEISPDGRQLVVSALSKGVSMLWVRPIAAPTWRVLPDTQGGHYPFWSPDSESVAFFAGGALKTAKISNGTVRVVCQTSGRQVPSGAWNRNGTILFGGTTEIWKVRETGGTPERVTTFARGESAHRWPSFLPDGDRFLYLAQSELVNELRIGSLTSKTTVSLGRFDSNAIYAAGHLLFVRGGRLLAQPMNASSGRLEANPIPITNRTAILAPWQRGQFSVSTNGRLAYSDVGRPLLQLTWMDRAGRITATAGEPGYYSNVDVSTDGERIAVSRHFEPPGLPWNVDIWSIELTRDGAMARLTTDPAREFDPAWSPDGGSIAFNSSRLGIFGLFRRPSNASGDDELLVKPERSITAPSWSEDGRLIVYTQGSRETKLDLWTVPVSSDRKPSVFLKTPFNEANGAFSPDGKWIAFEADPSARSEIYVRPFPAGDRDFPVSRDGGRAPRWRGDGEELFFLSLDGVMMAAETTLAGGFRASVPKPLFKTELVDSANAHPFDVSRDGQRFLIPVTLNGASPAPVTIVLDWPARIESR